MKFLTKLFRDTAQEFCGERLKWKEIAKGIKAVLAEAAADPSLKEKLKDPTPSAFDKDWPIWKAHFSKGEPYCVGNFAPAVARLPSKAHRSVRLDALCALEFDNEIGSLHRIAALGARHFKRLRKLDVRDQPLRVNYCGSSFVFHWLAGRDCCVRTLSHFVQRDEWVVANFALSYRPAQGFYSVYNKRGGASFQTGEFALGQYAYDHKLRLTDPIFYTVKQGGALLRDWFEHPDFRMGGNGRECGWQISDI
jgi:hypothetical protein